MMKTYKCEWNNSKNVTNHIDKHIIDTKYDYKSWKNLIVNESSLDYFNVINEYKTEISKPKTSLYKYYVDLSKSIVSPYNKSYLYHSNDHYSLNFEPLSNGYLNNLTTCTVFNKLNGRETDLNILSCFFKKHVVLDSCILVSAYKLYENPIDNLFKLAEVIKGVSYIHDKNLDNAFNYSCIDDLRMILPIKERQTRRFYRLIFYYLYFQYENVKTYFNQGKEIDQNKTLIYQLFLQKINRHFNFETIDYFTLDIAPADLRLKDRLNSIKQYLSIYDKNIPSYIITEIACLLFISDLKKEKEAFLNYCKLHDGIEYKACIFLLENCK